VTLRNVGAAAKPTWKAAQVEAKEVLRGQSRQPLFVTSVGLEDDAAQCVRKMHGEFRMPTLLKRVDQLCRQAAGAAP
jgi:deoxyribonuclease V